jgi:hypothetical protein
MRHHTAHPLGNHETDRTSVRREDLQLSGDESAPQRHRWIIGSLAEVEIESRGGKRGHTVNHQYRCRRNVTVTYDWRDSQQANSEYEDRFHP